MSEANLTEKDVLHVAKLAQLSLTDDELPRMVKELSAIVGYVRKLDELDTSDVPPTRQVQVSQLPLRSDEPRPSLPQDEALKEAPRTAEGGFAVPGFVDE